MPASKHRYYPHNTRILGRGRHTPNTHALRHHFKINTSVLTKLGRKRSDTYPAYGACWLPRASLRVLRRKRAVSAVQRPTCGARAMSPARHKVRTTARQLVPPTQSEIDHIYTLHGTLPSMVELRHSPPTNSGRYASNLVSGAPRHDVNTCRPTCEENVAAAVWRDPGVECLSTNVPLLPQTARRLPPPQRGIYT